MKGQISAEMLIILALVVVIALLVASQLLGIVDFFGSKVDEKTQALGETLDTGGCLEAGEDCYSDSVCCSGTCGSNNECT